MAFGRRKRGENGAAAVEFALIMPVLLMLLFGIIDFGYMINRGSMVNNAARDAVRVAASQGTELEVKATANAALSEVTAATVTVTCRKPDNTACSTSFDAGKVSGGTAIVKITYEHKALSPIGMFFPGGFSLQRKAEMRIEPMP